MSLSNLRGTFGEGDFTQQVAFAAALIAIAAMAVAMLSFLSADFLSGDAAQYLSVTEQLLAGKGLTTLTLYYESQLDQGLPAQQTIWPPGWPAIAAVVAGATSIESAAALGIVAVLAHAMTAILLFVVVVKVSGRPWVAAALAAGYMAYSGAWKFAISGFSEPLFVAALIGVAACLTGVRTKPGKSWHLLAGASLLMAVAMLVRYFALPFVAALGAAVLLSSLRRGRIWPALCEAIMVISPALLVLGAMTVRNVMVDGSLRGGPQTTSGLSLADVVLELAKSGYDLLGMEAGAIARLAGLVAIGSFAAVCAFVLLYQRRQLRWSSRHNTLLLFCILGSLFNFTFVVILALASTSFGAPSRFLSPAIPLLLVAFSILMPEPLAKAIGGTIVSGRDRTVISGLTAVTVTAVAVILAENAKWETDWFRTSALPRLIRTNLAASYQGEPITALLSRKGGIDAPIFSNQSQALFVVLRKPTIGLPSRRFARQNYGPDEIRAVATKLGAEYLVIFPKRPNTHFVNDDYLMLMTKQKPDFLSKLVATDDVELYRFVPTSVSGSPND
jgi:hypothetical protein